MKLEKPQGDAKEEHPHFALLAYLADVASTTDHLPDKTESFDEELAHRSIQDILTAAALAETLKNEIIFAASFEGNGYEASNFIYVEEDAETPTSTSNVDHRSVTKIGNHDTLETLEPDESPQRPNIDPLPEESTPSLGVTSIISEEDVDNKIGTVVSSLGSSHTGLISRPASSDGVLTKELLNEDGDHQDLISVTQVGDMIGERNNGDLSYDMQITLGQSVDDDVEELENTESGFIPCHNSSGIEDALSNETVRVDERGQYAVPEIRFYKDTTPDLLQQAEEVGVSQATTIFSFPSGQFLISSPKKRPICLAEQNDVSLDC